MTRNKNPGMYPAFSAVVFLGLAFGIFFTPGILSAEGNQENRIAISEERRIPPEGFSRIEVETSSVDVVAVPWAAEEILVELKGTVSTIPPTTDPPKLKVESSGNILRIEAGLPSTGTSLFRNVDLVVTVNLPEGFGGSLEIDTSSGDVTAEGFDLESISIDASSGDAVLTDTGCTTGYIETNSGDIHLRTILADTFTANSSSGGLMAEDITAPRFSRICSSGDTDIGDFTGGMNLKSSSGNVHIDVEELTAGIDLITKSGNVRLRIPEDAGFELRIETSSGEIDTDFPVTLISDGRIRDNRLSGTVGSGGPVIRVEASAGDVHILPISR